MGGDFPTGARRSTPANNPSTVDVAIMQRPCTRHISTALLKAHPTFFGLLAGMQPQTDHVWQLRRSGTMRITRPVAIDLYDSTVRSIDQLASCTDFAIPVSSPAFSGSRLRRRSPRNTARDRSRLRNLLPAPLKQCELSLHLAVEFWRCDRESVRDRYRERARCAGLQALLNDRYFGVFGKQASRSQRISGGRVKARSVRNTMGV
jgi:hypothetical protein